MDSLESLFSIVCGQNPGHTWTPGGELLPVCQRCTGLYAGATLAILLQLVFRPRPTARYLWVHGALLLQMVPQGFHLVPQEPLSRTISGVLFGAGLVAFLLLPLRPAAAEATGPGRSSARWGYGLGLALGTLLVLAGSAAGGSPSALLLRGAALAGLIALGGLVLLDVYRLVSLVLSRRGRDL